MQKRTWPISSRTDARAVVGWVAVLTALFAVERPAMAEPTLAHYLVQIQLHSEVCPPRQFTGLLSGDGQGRCRFVIYWKEPPDVFYDQSDCMAHVDFLMLGSRLYGWMGATADEPKRFEADLRADVPPLPLEVDDSIEFLKATAILAARQATSLSDDPTELGGLVSVSDAAIQALNNKKPTETSWVVPATTEPVATARPAGSSAPGTPASTQSFMPFGQSGKLTVSTDGTIRLTVCHLEDGEPVLDVTYRPTVIQETQASKLFDPDTLGAPPHVPVAYREFWRLSREYWRLTTSSSPQRKEQATAVYKAALERVNQGVPDCLLLPLYSLAARSASVAADVPLAAQALDGLLSHAQSSADAQTALAVMGQMQESLDASRSATADVNALFPPRIQQLLRLHIARPEDLLDAVDRLITHRDYAVAEAVLVELSNQALAEEDKVEALRKRIKGLRIAPDANPPDYVLSLRRVATTCPAIGQLTADELQSAIVAALEASGWDTTKATVFAEQVVGKVYLMAGPGPYRGDSQVLTKAIENAAVAGWPRPEQGEDPVSWLAGLLAVSFYDRSDASLHADLISQTSSCLDWIVDGGWGELESSEVFGAPVSREELRAHAEQTLQDVVRYVDDPLWPMFKYPLSENEMVRLRSQMALQIDAEVEELKRFVKNTDSPRLRRARLLDRISWLTRGLSARIVSIRSPRLIGLGQEMRSSTPLRLLWCLHIPEEPEEARKILAELLYFYLGHRLTDADALAQGQSHN